MNLDEAINLIRPDKPFIKSSWFDLGCGAGLFTYALASLLPPGSIIYAVDKNMDAFMEMAGFDGITIKRCELNFESDPLPFNYPEGILMANSLHFVKDKKGFIEGTPTFQRLATLIIVEYDTDIPNRWVPYPISFLSLKNTFHLAGFSSVIKINEKPSVFNNGNLYSAIIRP
ncbi:MAG: class I SAM-dependent methyltransferase [Ginsengibacter sp.]